MILIKGKMPKACRETLDERRMTPCFLFNYCSARMKLPTEPQIRHPDCPIVAEIPNKHGRLIDADVLYNKIIQNIKDLDENDENYDVMRAIYQSMLFELDNEIPTILETTE